MLRSHKIKIWARDRNDETILTFEIDGEKQSAAIKVNKKKKKATGTRA